MSDGGSGKTRDGQRASKASRLAVSVPSHCELLAEPAQSWWKRSAAWRFPSALCLPERQYRTRAGRQPERIADDLAMNMARTVRWQRR